MAKFYIDPITGTDDIGIGSMKSPFASFKPLIAIISTPGVHTITINEGTLELTSAFLKAIPANSNITLIGRGYNTKLKILENASNFSSISHSTSSLSFNKLVFDASEMDYYCTHRNVSYNEYYTFHYCMNFLCKLSFNNVLFYGLKQSLCFYNWDGALTNSLLQVPRHFFRTSNDINIHNCSSVFVPFSYYWTSRGNEVFIPFQHIVQRRYVFCNYKLTTNDYVFQESTTYNIKVENSYGNLGTNNNLWTMDLNNIIDNTNQFMDLTNYRVIDPTSNESEVGVYFGYYSWETADFMIWMDGNYYSIKEENYDTSSQMYKPFTLEDIITNSFSSYACNNIKELTTNVTYNNESFIPLSKFNNFKIISNKNIPLFSKGLKSTKELVVQNFDLYPTTFDKINSITIDKVMTGTSNIKIAFSKNLGETWHVFRDNKVIDLDCFIPSKNYSSMTASEKLSFHAAKEAISNFGMTLQEFESTDFNLIKCSRLRFAFVLEKTTYTDSLKLKNVLLNYNQATSRVLLSDDAYQASLFNHSISIIPKEDLDEIEVDIII